jgi:hypothetical protein
VDVSPWVTGFDKLLKTTTESEPRDFSLQVGTKCTPMGIVIRDLWLSHTQNCFLGCED